MVRLLLILLLFSTTATAQFNRQHLLKPKAAAATGGSETIFGTTAPAVASGTDGVNYNLGIKIIPTVSGVIDRVRWYKPAAMTATLSVAFFSLSAGTYTLLQTGSRTGDATLGWVEVTLASPVNVTAGTVYMAQVHTPDYYYATSNYFNTANIFSAGGHLYAPTTQSADNVTSGYNGVYVVTGTATTAANNSFNAGNYWVDVVFTPN